MTARDHNPNNVLHGAGGYLWVNGIKQHGVTSVEAKITGQWDEYYVCGDTQSYSKYNGYSGEGTLNMLALDSSMLTLLMDGFRSGEMPTISIITLHKQSDSKGERIAFYDVTFDDLMLAKFEANAKSEREYSFKFGRFEVLESI